jgi:DNA-binding transcriptional MerR regulator
MRMSKRQFRIGYLAKELGVDDFVIRFWEKEFNVASTRSKGGQRFYTSDDLEFFKKIQDLLHKKGFTIAGAKRELVEKNDPQQVSKISTSLLPSLIPAVSETIFNTDLIQKCCTLKRRLLTLKDLL